MSNTFELVDRSIQMSRLYSYPVILINASFNTLFGVVDVDLIFPQRAITPSDRLRAEVTQCQAGRMLFRPGTAYIIRNFHQLNSTSLHHFIQVGRL